MLNGGSFYCSGTLNYHSLHVFFMLIAVFLPLSSQENTNQCLQNTNKTLTLPETRRKQLAAKMR